MSAPVVAFFSPKGGQGRTTLVYHLAWMFSDLGVRVVAADLDHQGTLTQHFLGPDRATALEASETVLGALRNFVPKRRNCGEAPLVFPGGKIALLAGDIGVLEIEPALEHAWLRPSTADEQTVAALTALRRVLRAAAEQHSAAIVLVDLAPSGGIINRAVFSAADHFVFPLVPDALGVRSMQWTGQQMQRWRAEWQSRRGALADTLATPEDGPGTLGYVVQMLRLYAGRPIGAQQRLIDQIPAEFERWIARSERPRSSSIANDEYCLGVLSSFVGLFEIAAEATKPVFHLTPADGAVGSVMTAVQKARTEFQSVARVFADRLKIPLD